MSVQYVENHLEIDSNYWSIQGYPWHTRKNLIVRKGTHVVYVESLLEIHGTYGNMQKFTLQEKEYSNASFAVKLSIMQAILRDITD